jgi:hypothetical protein
MVIDKGDCLENSTKKIIQSCGMGILPVLVLLAGKMPAPQEILGYFFNWKSLSIVRYDIPEDPDR